MLLCFVLSILYEITGLIRLVDGEKSVNFYSGRVEIQVGGEWGTVCGDTWTENEADVVCHQLGYEYSRSADTRAYYGPGKGRIWLRNVTCDGGESKLTDCTHSTDVDSCDHFYDAGVSCITGEFLVGSNCNHCLHLTIFATLLCNTTLPCT